MQPEIDLFGLPVQTFGLMFALGFVACWAVIRRRLIEIGKPADWAPHRPDRPNGRKHIPFRLETKYTPAGDQPAAIAELVATAEAGNRVLMVGPLLRFHPVFQQLHDITASGELGRMLYLYTNRLNFGKVRADENALWSLAPHDISLALAIAGERPEEVSARGEAFLREGVEDVVFGYLHFPSGLVAHLHVSWLDPHKSRKLTVVGSEGMAVFDDTEADRKLTVYEKASSPSRFDTWGEFQALRTGDVRIPQVPNAEPLVQETKAFVAAIREGRATVASGAEGLAVVEVLTALQTSLEQRGAPIRLDG